MTNNKRKFKRCPECNSRGKPISTKYDKGFICTENLCSTVYYGDKS